MPDNNENTESDRSGLDAQSIDETDAALGDREIDAEPANTDGEETPDARELGERLGGGFGKTLNGLRLGVSRVWTGFLYAASSTLGTDKVWQNRFKKNIKRMYKSTSADAIGFVVQKNGAILPTPVKYRPPDIDDEDNPHGYWEAGHMDQTFDAATGANATETINNIPVIFLHTDDWAEASFSGALLGEAVDIGRTEELYQDPSINIIEIEQPAPSADMATDGGVESHVRAENVTPGALKDVAIDVESIGKHDGTRVRWEKFKDLRMEQTTVEEMNQVQERGRLAGLREAMGDDNKHMIKWFVLGMVALGLGAFYLGAQTGGASGGGGGGGGGGMMPFMMTMDSMLQTLTVGVGWL